MLICGQFAVAAEASKNLPAQARKSVAGTSGQRNKLNIKLIDLGVQGPIRLKGADDRASVGFSFHTTDIVERLRVKLNYSYSPGLEAETSSLTVTLNNREIGTFSLPRNTATRATQELDIDPILLQEWNQLAFHFVSHVAKPLCDDPRSTLLWIQFDNKETQIEAITSTLPVTNDLSIFPVPFFDKHDTRNLKLPFVFGAKPSFAALKSAGILASWFGSKAEWRQLDFPGHLNDIPKQDAILLATAQEHIDGIELPAVKDGVATIMMIDNPRNPQTHLLLIVGKDDEGLVEATQALTSGAISFAGKSVSVQAFSPPKRELNDSPNWLQQDKIIRVKDVVPQERLVSNSYFVSPYEMVLRLPPNLYRAESLLFPFDVKFKSSNNTRYLAQYEAYINGIKFQHGSFSKPEVSDPMVDGSIRLNIPTKNLTTRDTFTVKFIFADKTHEICTTATDRDEIRIDPDSTIDLTKIPKYYKLPDISYLAYAGFPYSKFADLSETVVLMPNEPDQYEIKSMLTLLGHIGNQTAYPATSVSIAPVNEVDKYADKDILVIGSTEHLSGILDSWKRHLPVNLLTGEISFPHFGSNFTQRFARWTDLSARFGTLSGDKKMVLVGIESPLEAKRSAILLTAKESSSLPEITSTLSSFQEAKGFAGDVVAISENKAQDRATAFQSGTQFATGEITFRLFLNEIVHHNPWVAFLMTFLMAFFFALLAYRKMMRLSKKRLGNS